MRPPVSKQAAFLAKDTYRLRRMRDLARAVPIIGSILLVMPLLWIEGTHNSAAVVYIFAVWVFLIILSAAISKVVSADPPKSP